MVFLKKKKGRKEEEIKAVKRAVEGKKPRKVAPKEAPPPKPPRKREEMEPVFAPLFIKIEKYRSLLEILNDLKVTTIMIKDALASQKEIDRLKEENRSLIEASINKIDQKISSLDAEFLRPRGFREELAMPPQRTGDLDETIGNLRSQIEKLKSELKRTG